MELEHPFLVLERDSGAVCGKRLLIPMISTKITFTSQTPSNKLINSRSGLLWFIYGFPNYLFITSLGHQIKSVRSRIRRSIIFNIDDSYIINDSPDLQILDIPWELHEEGEERILDSYSNS